MLEFNLKKLRFEQGLSQEELGKMLGVTKQQIGRIENGHSKLTDEKRKMLLDLFPGLQSNTVTAAAKLPPDIIKIPYWSGLPEELKISDFTCVTAERNVIKNHWYLNPDSLCIVPMFGNKMANYWYKINDSDILIIDTSHNKIVGNGVYFATSQNNTRFWIREMQNLINNDVEFKAFSPSGNTTRVMTKQQLEEVDFKVIGKVVKNVSFRL